MLENVFSDLILQTGTYVQKSVCPYVTPHCYSFGLLVNEQNFTLSLM